MCLMLFYISSTEVTRQTSGDAHQLSLWRAAALPATLQQICGGHAASRLSTDTHQVYVHRELGHYTADLLGLPMARGPSLCLLAVAVWVLAVLECLRGAFDFTRCMPPRPWTLRRCAS